jgi:hypothetical protein
MINEIGKPLAQNAVGNIATREWAVSSTELADARKTLKPAYHNRKVVSLVERKLIKEATQGLSRFE